MKCPFDRPTSPDSLCLIFAQVKRVYVLARAKRTTSPHDRVALLLRSGLFHQVRAQDSNAGRRVVVLAGDVSSPNLGLSGAELDLLLSDVTVVLHCAASVALDADIQATLRCDCTCAVRVIQALRHS